MRKNITNGQQKNKKDSIYNDIKLPIYITGGLLLITVLFSIYFDEIPILIKVGIYNSDDFWKSFLINIHNTLLDTLIFGIIVVYFTKKSEKRRSIERYIEAIDDNRFLFTDEASYRIATNIKRLNNNKVYQINLTKCNLKKAVLTNSKLDNSEMMGADLEEINLKNSSLIGVDMKGANLRFANLNGANLSLAKLRNIKCNESNFTGSCLGECDLLRAILENSNFTSADFRGADLSEVSYRNSTFHDANFIGAKNIEINKLLESKSLKKAKFDEYIKEQIELEKPELLRK